MTTTYESSIDGVSDFMQSPLVAWASTLINDQYSPQRLEYDNFPNGQYFYRILKQCDPRLQNSNLPEEGQPSDSTRARLINLDYIIRHIRAFYSDTLNNILLVKLPDIYEIAKYTDSEKTFHEMEKILTLLLGIAINGDYKHIHIQRITNCLSEDLQVKLVPYIEKITNDETYCLSKSIQFELSQSVTTLVTLEINNNNSSSTEPTTVVSSDPMASSIHTSCSLSTKKFCDIGEINGFVSDKLISNIQRIVDERDCYLEELVELKQDKDFLEYQLKPTGSLPSFLASADSSDLLAIKNNLNHQSSFLSSVNRGAESTNDLMDSGALCGAPGTNSSLLELSDTRTLMMLIESIYKEMSQNSQQQGFKPSYDGDKDINQSNQTDNRQNQPNSNVSSPTTDQNVLNNFLFGLDGLNTSNLNSKLLNDLKARKLHTNNWNQKIAIELVECKIKLKQLINEIEEKCDQMESLKDEIDEVKKQINKLRNENVDLQQKAALANVYSDELETLREKSLKVDKYELELSKLKERIEELQNGNERIENLRDENAILIETRSIIEKQLNDYQVRLLGMQRLDNDLNKYKQEIEDLLNQRELDKKRLCELCEKNAKLELDMKTLLNQNVNLDEEINYYKQKFAFTSAELSKQQQLLINCQQHAQTQATQLIESNKLKIFEIEQQNSELQSQIRVRDQELSKLKENIRLKEASLDECYSKIKVLNEELSIEQENKIKCERTLEQHKLEIKELQVKLDDCVSETKKLDYSIRHAAQTNEQKETENQENFKRLIESHEQLNSSYKKLLSDHEQLQKIYLQLESDYDELYDELTKKHSLINSLNGEIDELKEKYNNYENMYDEVKKELDTIKDKKFENAEVLTDENEATLQNDRQELEHFYEMKFEEMTKEISLLKDKREMVEGKVKELSKDLESTTDENIKLKNENKSFQMEINKNVEMIKINSMQHAQLTEKIQTLDNLNEKLEDEKSQLYEQLHLLLQQNQEILTQTLNSKDMYHEETKAYLLQMSNLKRQKEMLEQKIMEQYKNSPSQKQKGKKSPGSNGTTGNGNNGGIIRQFVQKVRNKSSSSSSTSSNLPDSNMIIMVPSGVNDSHHDDDTPMATPHSNTSNIYCHKYSADDINYLNIQPKDISKITPSKSSSSSSSTSTQRCLSSSSSTSSSSPTCLPLNQQLLITPTKTQQNASTPIKLDPKSLKLGGRPQSICSSSSCSSPTTIITQSVSNSPTNTIISNGKQGQTEFKRALLTSSPKYISTNQMNPLNQSPSSSTSSCSSTSSAVSSSSSSASSLIAKVSSVSTPNSKSTSIVSTPSKISQSPSILLKQSPQQPVTAILTKSKNNNSTGIQLISNNSPMTGLVQMGRPQKIALKIADSLSKFRQSAEMDLSGNYDRMNHDTENDDDEDDDDDDEDIYSHLKQDLIVKNSNGKLVKSKTANQKNGTGVLSVNNSNSSSTKNTNSNEIWLEYGCI